jgi:carboxyl-terminal processing protease
LRFLHKGASPGAVEVPLEDVSRSVPNVAETEFVRQVLRIIDQHYVQRDRLDPVRLLQSGFQALAKDTGEDVEFVRDVEPFLHRDFDRNVVRLCAWRAERRVAFCEAGASAGRLAQAGGEAFGPLAQVDPLSRGRLRFAARGAPSSDTATPSGVEGGAQAPFETPAVRVGERVFYSNQSSSIGLRYIESLARPVMSEIVRARRVPPAKAMHAFLNGLLDELDPHSSYLSMDEYKELRSGTRGQFGGVGLVIDEVHELPLIREIVPNSPAHMAGIKPGDVLLRVGSKVVSFLPLDAVLKEIREVTMDAPTPVWLYRPGSGRIFRVFLTREEIPTRSVETKVVLSRPDVLHVRVTGFSSHTADDILQAYEDALRASRDGLRLFILDLRGNPGGLLDQAIQVADLFLRQGRIVSTRSRYDEQVEFVTKGRKIDLPVAVLVNSSSASASEIVAGALKDHDRAVIVGERSFGKGSVQSLFELGSGTALKLTIAHYFTPSGQSLQSVGVMPHVQVKLVQTRPGALWMSGSSEPEREESLSAHLDNPDSRQVRSTLPLATRGTEDGVVWSHTAPSHARVEGLEELNFSYPSIENLESVTDLGVDSVARVGIGLLDRLLEREPRMVNLTVAALPDALDGLQKSEARLLRAAGLGAASAAQVAAAAQSGAEDVGILGRRGDRARRENEARRFVEATESFFDPEAGNETRDTSGVHPGDDLSLAEPVRPRIGGFEKLFVRSGLGEHGVNTCCHHDDYMFRLTGEIPDAPTRGATGFVGMRLEENADGNLVWVPAALRTEGKGVWTGGFTIPQVFRAFLSEQPRSGGGGVSFFFKRRLASAPVLLGVLPLERHGVADEGGEIGAPGRDITPRLDVTLKRTPQGDVLQVRVAGKSVPVAPRYVLVLVPLADGRLELGRRAVSLEPSSTGDLMGEVSVTVHDRGTPLQGQSFGGVIGGILRTEQGEVLGKWPIAYVDEDGLRTARTLPAAIVEGQSAEE